MTDMDPELRRRINKNLAELADGTVARREAARRAAKAAAKKAHREYRSRLKAIARRVAEVTTERDGLQEYLDLMLDKGEEWPGGIDETDHAVEGCNEELAALDGERQLLETLLHVEL